MESPPPSPEPIGSPPLPSPNIPTSSVSPDTSPIPPSSPQPPPVQTSETLKEAPEDTIARLGMHVSGVPTTGDDEQFQSFQLHDTTFDPATLANPNNLTNSIDNGFEAPAPSSPGKAAPEMLTNHFPTPPRDTPYSPNSAQTPVQTQGNAFAVRSWSGAKNFDTRRYLGDDPDPTGDEAAPPAYPFNYDEVEDDEDDEEKEEVRVGLLDDKPTPPPSTPPPPTTHTPLLRPPPRRRTLPFSITLSCQPL